MACNTVVLEHYHACKSAEVYRVVQRRIAHRLRELRSGKGLTQEIVANRAGLALRHLQKIEAAQVNPTIDSLVKIAVALDVDPEELLSKDEC